MVCLYTHGELAIESYCFISVFASSPLIFPTAIINEKSNITEKPFYHANLHSLKVHFERVLLSF